MYKIEIYEVPFAHRTCSLSPIIPYCIHACMHAKLPHVIFALPNMRPLLYRTSTSEMTIAYLGREKKSAGKKFDKKVAIFKRIYVYTCITYASSVHINNTYELHVVFNLSDASNVPSSKCIGKRIGRTKGGKFVENKQKVF